MTKGISGSVVDINAEEMFPRSPQLRHVVFVAACLVGMSLLVILWHFDLTDKTRSNRSDAYPLSIHKKTIEEHASQKHNNLNNNASIKFTEKVTSEKKMYEHVHTLLLFVGYSRSRHSLVSSLLDAHPHMIVADESYALRKWVYNSAWKTEKSKYEFFDTMMGNSARSVKRGRRSRQANGSAANLKIFGYSVPGQWQGTYDRYIQVIGDKTAWDSAVMLRLHGTQAIYEMKNKLGVNIKFIHVVRNPFDNIATFVLRHKHIQARTADLNIKINASEILDEKIQLYNNWAEGTFVAHKSFPEDFLSVVSMDVVKKPTESLRKMCHFLQVTCSDRFIQDCAAIVDPVPSITRHRIIWTEKQINNVYAVIRAFPAFFEGFTFEDV
ncbi:hypothetical protein AWC38_SpisGene16719 [Stylophora pistillata]|uniref:Protein-tyrosine sulfotransferase n=1 Tax=Stylophora pistillata TaxID=50429 RepID=A0A2B4RQ10_STYPI|nr:hypothetical protein AWC38_SpisGene16719 [Stylophora pistillata]